MTPNISRSAVVQPLPPDVPRIIPNPKTKLAEDVEKEDQPLLTTSSADDSVSNSEVDTSIPVKSTSTWSMKRARALGFIVFAGLNFSIASICIKYASHRVTSHETVFWRMIVALVLNYIWIRYKKQELFVEPKYRGLLLFRCIVGTISVNIQFYAISQMVLTDAVVIILTSPIFTFFLGAAVLGEQINRVDLIAGITSFLGVMFVTRPSFLFPTDTTREEPMLAVYCAIGGSFLSAVVYILLRRLTKVHHLVAIHYFFVFGSCTSIMTLLILGVTIKVPLEVGFFFAIFGSGFFSFIGQVFMTKGFQQEKAGIASVMRYFDVVFVVAMDVFILGENVNALSLVGAGIIMIGVSMIVLRRAREKDNSVEGAFDNRLTIEDNSKVRMLSRSCAHGLAVVTPLPPNLSTDPIKKPIAEAGPSGDDESTRDDLPLLKPNNSSDEISKIDEEEIVTIVLPSASNTWSLGKVRGLGYIVIAAFNFSIVSACVKNASHYANSNIIVFWRMLIGLSMNCIWVRYKKANLFVARKDRFLLLFRCLVGTSGTTLSFYAMSNMPLTDAVVIIFTSPIFTFFLAAVVLGETIDYVDLIGGVTSFIGVLFVTRPAILFPSHDSGNSAPFSAIFCAMGSSLSQAIVYISMRKMKDLDNLLVIHYFLMFGAVYSTFMVWALGVKYELPLEPGFLLSIFGCAFFSLLGQWFLTKGFQTVKAGIASVMRYFDVVFVMCLDAMVLGETVNLYSILGAAIIISGASVIVMRQAVAKK